MRVVFTKGLDGDGIQAHRSDGSTVESSFPKKGVIPHDAVHLIVERELGFEEAFWGRVFSGSRPEDVAALVKAGGHASSARAQAPEETIVELLQAERLVECFEAQMWSDPASAPTFRSVLAAACDQSQVAAPDIADATIEAIQAQLVLLKERWQALAVGQALALDWR